MKNFTQVLLNRLNSGTLSETSLKELFQIYDVRLSDFTDGKNREFDFLIFSCKTSYHDVYVSSGRLAQNYDKYGNYMHFNC